MVQRGLLEAFYLLASSKAWAGGNIEKTSISHLPGAKVLVFEEGPFRYVDMYYAKNNQSFGQTVIWVFARGIEWMPAWGMLYGGGYPERVISFLKTALLKSYEEKQFIGGRGLLSFREGNLLYLNHPEKNEFQDFHGWEEVIENGVQLGFHWYRGLLLL